ncbi:MAG: transposase [Actinomycetia bacterium]|nr:transposase [Actinomycetes bacterium]
MAASCQAAGPSYTTSGDVNNGYPADLTDAQWAMLEPLLPQPWTGHPRTRDLRQIFNGILYELRSGCAWRLVPNEFGPWVTVYYYFRKWRDDGTWERLN